MSQKINRAILACFCLLKQNVRAVRSDVIDRAGSDVH